ncbi:aminopeptidase [Halodesulfurarchaeum sp. HSR-GB]|uniref:aminopeptidase n=1 Tax=Halodesulfurarchaeum sp. HSR-GB TaxID=3074077 RepID=UPI0028594E01|nr:aminopeptidase [Halodesulfurarchaeum sp. HSR-GB]MDR5655932.1 aminopeptidase [Halodesulfurarchaeum sp. HSR-GB]
MGLRPGAETAVHQCLDLQPEERCVVVTDDERRPIGEALYEVAAAVTDDAVLLTYPPGKEHGQEPPDPVAGAIKASDTFLAPTTKSISHTRARSDATDAGVRGATLPGITEAVFEQGLEADYDRIRETCERVHQAVADADEIRVTAPAGTDIVVEPGDREWRLDTGDVTEPGSFSNLPAGEVFISPQTATGRYVVDGTMRPYGRLEAGQTLAFEVDDGVVTDIEDDQIRETVEGAAESVGEAAFNLAELGIGTNVAVSELVGSVLLDEKAAGTVHFAIGDDAGIGGDTDAPIHLDGVIREPTVFVDGEEIELPAPNAANT